MFSQIKDIKHIEQNFHFVARVMPQGWVVGALGGSETLAWGFGMVPHRLCILVFNLFLPIPQHFNSCGINFGNVFNRLMP